MTPLVVENEPPVTFLRRKMTGGRISMGVVFWKGNSACHIFSLPLLDSSGVVLQTFPLADLQHCRPSPKGKGLQHCRSFPFHCRPFPIFVMFRILIFGCIEKKSFWVLYKVNRLFKYVAFNDKTTLLSYVLNFYFQLRQVIWLCKLKTCNGWNDMGEDLQWGKVCNGFSVPLQNVRGKACNGGRSAI